jgi:hypothetical protein
MTSESPVQTTPAMDRHSFDPIGRVHHGVGAGAAEHGPATLEALATARPTAAQQTPNEVSP